MSDTVVDMTSSDQPVAPSREAMMLVAQRVDEDSDDLLGADFHAYSDDINRLLLELREGRPLDDEVKAELDSLYDDWESEGFPVDEEDDDIVTEGKPVARNEVDSENEADDVARNEDDDPDLEPDPEDAPDAP